MSVGVTAGVGVTAHVTWHEFETRGKAFAMMQAAGMDYVRSDFHYWRCRPKKPGEAWSFGMYDQVVDEAGRCWVQKAEQSDWKTPSAIKADFASASFLSGNRVVFNIGGNNFRLVVIAVYVQGMLVVDWIGTHAEYDKKRF